MRVLTATAGAFGAVAIVVVGACLSNREAAPKSPLLHEPLQCLMESDRAAELERQRLTLLERVATKIELHRMLLRGELSLPEAAVRLREVLRNNPGAYAQTIGQYSGCSEMEAFCQHLLHYGGDNDADGASARSVIARLEADLTDLIRSGALSLRCAPTPATLLPAGALQDEFAD